MSFKVLRSERNELLHREDYVLEIERQFEPVKREVVREIVAKSLAKPKENTFIVKIRFKPGTDKLEVYARVYDKPEYALRIERPHIIRRNEKKEEKGEEGGKT